MKQVTSEELVNVASHKPEETPIMEALGITCWFCRNFQLKFSPLDYSGHRCTFTNEKGETGLLGKCLKHSLKETTSLTIACDDYDYAYITDRFCKDIAIFNDASVNDECRSAEFNCDKCFTKEFWMEVLESKDHHFKSSKPHSQMGLHSIYSFVPSGQEGGFDNDRFNLRLSSGETFTDVGLWHRGFCPNDEILNQLRTGYIEEE